MTNSAIEKKWVQLATSDLLAYARGHYQFTAEDVWAVIEHDIGPAASPNSKGYLFRVTLIEPGHVVKYGTAKAKNRQAKGRVVVVWKSTLCQDPTELVPLQARLSHLHAEVNLHKITLMEALKKAYAIGAGSADIHPPTTSKNVS